MNKARYCEKCAWNGTDGVPVIGICNKKREKQNDYPYCGMKKKDDV